MLEMVKNFLFAEDGGGAVEWILTIIVGALIVAAIYISLKDSPGNLGGAIGDKGSEVAQEIRDM